jgi:hypothetical protein
MMVADPLAPLDELLAAPGGVLAVPDTWQVGRGAFGGFVTGAMIRALEASAPDRPLRSFTAALCGPLQPGEARIELAVQRAGSAMTTTAVTIVQGGEVMAHATGVLGAARAERETRVSLRAPELPAWRDVTAAPLVGGPPFAQHFEFRVVVPLGDICGWVRPRRPGARRDAAYLAACIDAYWPTILDFAKPRPMATIAFTFQPLAMPAGDAPLAYRARLLAGADGHIVEQRELWSEDGHVLALNQQTFVVIK